MKSTFTNAKTTEFTSNTKETNQELKGTQYTTIRDQISAQKSGNESTKPSIFKSIKPIGPTERQVGDINFAPEFVSTSKSKFSKKRPMLLDNKKGKYFDSLDFFKNKEKTRETNQKIQNGFYEQVKQGQIYFANQPTNMRIEEIKTDKPRENRYKVKDSADFFMKKYKNSEEELIVNLKNQQFAIQIKDIDEDFLEHKKLKFLDFDYRELRLKHFDSADYFLEKEKEKQMREKIRTLVEEELEKLGPAKIDSAEYYMSVARGKERATISLR